MRFLIFTTTTILFLEAVFGAGGDWNSGFRDVATEIMKIQNLNSKQRCELGLGYENDFTGINRKLAIIRVHQSPNIRCSTVGAVRHFLTILLFAVPNG